MLSRLVIATVVAMGVGGAAYAQPATTGVATSTGTQTLTSVPTTATKHTQSPGAPPRFCVRARPRCAVAS